MKKKLAIFLYSMASGGAERVVSQLLPHLEKHYEVTLVLMNKTLCYDISPTVKVYFIENSDPNENGLYKLLKIPFLAFRYAKFLSNNSITHSLSFMNRPNYINCIAKKFQSHTHTIISERGSPKLQYAGVSAFALINKIMIKVLYPIADSIIVNSKGTAYQLRETFNIHKPLYTIYNPIDMTKIETLNSLADKKNKKFKMVTVGRLDEGKDHIKQIHVLSLINNPDLELHIIGDGPLKGHLESEIIRLNLENQIYLHGRQNPFSLLKKCDLFLFTSKREGFPNVLLEALACDLPIISTDCSNGPRELLDPQSDFQKRLSNGYEYGEFGILVALDDINGYVSALEQMLKRADLVQKYRNKAKIRANDFDINKISPLFIKAINETNTY